MTKIDIHTAQHVNVHFEAADISYRLTALLIDLAIMYAYVIICSMFVQMTMPGLTYIGYLLYLPIIFYHLLFEWLFEGQTPGKRIRKIRVVRLDGYRMTFVDHFTRWAFRILECTAFLSVIAFISILVTKYQQRIGDLVTGTTVARLTQNIEFSDTVYVKIPEDHRPTYASVLELTDKDVVIIKDVLKIVHASTEPAEAADLANQAASKVKSVIGVESQKSDVGFLKTIVKDYNYYTQRMG